MALQLCCCSICTFNCHSYFIYMTCENKCYLLNIKKKSMLHLFMLIKSFKHLKLSVIQYIPFIVHITGLQKCDNGLYAMKIIGKFLTRCSSSINLLFIWIFWSSLIHFRKYKVIIDKIIWFFLTPSRWRTTDNNNIHSNNNLQQVHIFTFISWN